MKFQVEHEISWQYDQPVFIEPMTIRLRPRCDGSLHLKDWRLTLNPLPSGHCDAIDALGNAVSQAWFNEKQSTLSILATSSLETLRHNPFDYLLLGDESKQLPFHYEESLQSWLLPYLLRPSAAGPIDRWASAIASANNLVQPFLSALVSTMFTQFERNTREVGPAFAPDTTYTTQCGTCRDLAVLFMDACRSQGIASRFVSGYAYEQDREGSSDLHAWAEVYLPGAGWRGYDPTLGVAVSDQHIPLVAAAEPIDAAPTTGTFRGTEAQSRMAFDVRIQALGAIA